MGTATTSSVPTYADLHVANDVDADTEIFGSEEKAVWWMTEPNAALDGRTPFDVALTAPGAVLVDDLLAGLDRGVPV